jgi:putative nucleotidyltransferase with HDIG domain
VKSQTATPENLGSEGEAREKEELKLLILKTLDIPLLPTAMNTILRISGKNGSRVSNLADVISSNRSLAERILRVANSECFGLSQHISEVHRAIKVLGYEAVKSLSLSVLVMDALAEKREPGLFDHQRFWTHSLACAYLSRKIAALTHQAEMEMMFVCGLLHDIGKAFLMMHFPDSYNHVITLVETGPLTAFQGEEQVLGFTHAEVGMWLVQRWNLPKPVVFTIANHHYAVERGERHDALTSILRLADHLCLSELMSLENRRLVEPLEKVIMENLKFADSDLNDLRGALVQERSKLRALARVRD